MIAQFQKWLQRPSHEDMVRHLKAVQEQRDVLEERVYDLQWHLERAQKVAQQFGVYRPEKIGSDGWKEQIKRDFDADCC